MAMPQLRDGDVWRAVRLLYLGSGLLFLGTIGLGIANALMSSLSRGQILAHFHSGSIGWVTLSVIATTVWLYTGQRTVSPAYRNVVWLLAGLGIVSATGYVAAFALAFNGGPFWMLPLFGIPMGLVIVTALTFTLLQVRHQPVVTTPHLLLLGALLVASLGATMGVLIGLSHADVLDAFPDREGVDMLGAHAGPMDMYLALAFGAIVELLVVTEAVRRTRAGIAQMVLGVVSGFLTSIGLFTGFVMPLAPIALLMFLVAFGFYVVRVGWRALATNPLAGGRSVPTFFGGVFFPVYIVFFVAAVALFFIPGKPMPHALGVAMIHTIFIGMATNLLLAMRSTFPEWSGGVGPPVSSRLLGGAAWALNLGMLAFFAGEFLAGRKEGAFLMAGGVLVAMVAVERGIWRARPRSA
ncbi:MAG TPA: hypothetical protein VM327_08045 [Candidatus Thermoplasmatota archaeon]|nr:hypothetical protein [Candidatus Thermoplasmatota archaeon]